MKKATVAIEREVFLLAYTKFDFDKNTLLAYDEGKPLQYFLDDNHIVANHLGKACSYSLRSAYLGDMGMTWGIGSDGTFSGGDCMYENGVCSAFCVSNLLKIQKSDSAIKSK